MDLKEEIVDSQISHIRGLEMVKGWIEAIDTPETKAMVLEHLDNYISESSKLVADFASK